VNLDIAAWDRVLTEALTRPGEAARLPWQPGSTFRWHDYSTPEWSGEQACQRLGIHRIEFPMDCRLLALLGGQLVQGFATVQDGQVVIALNPDCGNRIRTIAHELAHILLQHPQNGIGKEDAPLVELEADATAMLVCFALDQSAAVLADSRTYVQHQRDRVVDTGALPTSWTHIKQAANTIIASGIGMAARAEYRRVETADAARIAKVHRDATVQRTKELATFSQKVRWSTKRR
jgi:hypothetical protein